MGKNNKDLSHEEVWDDSALIDSWNDALAEYKKYHSIHAKGGSVRDLEQSNRSTTKPDAQSDRPEESFDDGEVADEGATDEQGTTTAQEGPSDHGPKPGPGAFPVQAVLGSIQDENLKKLLMSWYYAGYYTGLFEGQQQAQQSQKP